MTARPPVVVTGATGHLGRHVLRALATLGHSIVATSRSGLRPQELSATHGLTSCSLDLDDDESVGALARLLSPGAVLIHLAALHPPSTATTGPQERASLIETNVLGTMRALEAARSAGTKHVVYASSFEVYGEPLASVIDETHPTRPLTDYGATKLAGEDHLDAFCQEQDATGVSLRLPAIYGPGETTQRALPNFLRAVASGQRPIVHGDGQDHRALLHVRDAAQAVVRAMGARTRLRVNVSDGQPHTILSLAYAAMVAAGMNGEPAFSPRSKPRRDYVLSTALARGQLGFQPAVSLHEGVQEQLAWLKGDSATR